MQIQRTNNYNPNFQAYKLSSLTDRAKKIDIYSLTSKDGDIIDRMLNVARGQKFPDDSKKLGIGSVKEIFNNALKRAKKITASSNDKVLLAVEDNSRITGIMDIREAGDMHVKGLAVWNGNNTTRDGLVSTALNDVYKTTKDFACLILPTAKSSDTIKTYFRKLGFKTPKDFGNKDLMVEGHNLQTTIEKIKNQFGDNYIDLKQKKNFDLKEVLKLDE